MKKSIYRVYILIIFALCLIPAVFMFLQEDEVVANEISMEPPEMIEAGKLNTEYPAELTAYIDKNFGFRQEMITANGFLRSLLGQSGNEKVILGRDGWLFFEETVKDYTGRRTMDDREIFCAAQNLKILQRSVEETGSRFYFTVAPNKNSLYGEYMPLRFLENREDSNYAAMEPYLTEMDFYIDLFSPLEKEKEDLYFREDSHWNNRGALLAGNEILKAAGKTERSYEGIPVKRESTHRGDLYEMAYPKSGKLDEEVHYDIENRFEYLYEVRDNDEPLIETFCSEGRGSLICFRDSFGTALLPYLADVYQRCWFSKETPYNFTYAESYLSGDVLIELVERNLDQLCQTAPIIGAPQCSRVVLSGAEEISADFTIEEEDEWYRITGKSGEKAGCTELFYVQVGGISSGRVYEPFYLDNDCFELRIPLESGSYTSEDFTLYKKKG